MVGLGYGMVITSWLIGLYYNVVISYVIFYLFASLTSLLPWTNCGNDWNTEYCVGPNSHHNTSGMSAISFFITLQSQINKIILSNNQSLTITRSVTHSLTPFVPSQCRPKISFFDSTVMLTVAGKHIARASMWLTKHSESKALVQPIANLMIDL